MLASAMPSEITRERIAAIAALASLELDPAEVELFARQLGDVLAYADEVRKVDTTGVPPTAAVGTESRLERDDENLPCLDVRDVLANAPDVLPAAGLFRVPRVLG